jgi:hypothetical protein
MQVQDINSGNTKSKMSKKKKWMIAGITIVVLLVIFRLLLPYIVLKYVNKTLSNLEEYYGHVEDIDIALIRGAYQINAIRIDKIDKQTKAKDSIPFFISREIDLSVEWRAIFKGRIVGEIYVEDPVLNFVKGKHKNEDVIQDTADFREVIKKLMPLTINHFEINNGQIRYVDQASNPKVDIAMVDLIVKADNLSNANDSNKVLPARLKANGNAYDGTFELNVDFNALEKQPTFDMNATIDHVNLVKLNDFLKAYGNFDVKKGTFGLYTEFAAKKGDFNGYVKPILKDLDVVQFNKQEGDAVQIMWEAVVGSVAEIFQNQKKEQLATKVPLKGSFKDPDAGLWTAISYVLRNAFVMALQPSVDNTINIANVEPAAEKQTFLQRVFGKKDKDTPNSKDSKKEKRRDRKRNGK